MPNINDLLDVADLLDKEGFITEANLVDEYVDTATITKQAKKGTHKCGLKEEVVLRHEELLDSYDKAMNSYEKEYKKLVQSNNDKDSSNDGKLRDIAANYAHNCNAVRFHNMYFDDVINCRPCSVDKDSLMKELLKDLYDGGPNKFESELKRLAKVSRSGWVVLNYCTVTKQLYLSAIDLHDQHVIACALPVMALDMWEHAYTVDFGLDKEAYVDWFLSRVDFRNVRKRIKNFQRIK